MSGLPRQFPAVRRVERRQTHLEGAAVAGRGSRTSGRNLDRNFATYASQINRTTWDHCLICMERFQSDAYLCKVLEKIVCGDGIGRNDFYATHYYALNSHKLLKIFLLS